MERIAEIGLADETATARLGADLALALRRGDLVALGGELGAGKTTLARGLIRALAGDDALEVPSPTFTLAQLYETSPAVAHFDLYRLSAPDEVRELGIDEALERGIALVEWPERGAGAMPEPSLTVTLVHDGEGRRAILAGAAEIAARVARSMAIRTFLDAAGLEGAERHFLLGDASTRAYETVSWKNSRPAILMNAPQRPDGPPVRDGLPYSRIAHLAENVIPFVAIDIMLRDAGFAAPEIFAQDLDQGLLLIENLGSEGIVDVDGSPVLERYEACARLLAAMHGRTWPDRIAVAPGVEHVVPPYDRRAMTIEVELLTDWYIPFRSGAPVARGFRAAFLDAWDGVFDRLETTERSLVLRDYHSPNVIWRPQHTGHDRIGLIDFQDAVIGPSAYDVASLAQDARVTIPPALEERTVAAYRAARHEAGSFDGGAFEFAYAAMAAQRNSKILGIFVRLNVRDGKPGYLKHLPRIRSYLARALAHPALSDLARLYREAGLLDGEVS